MSIYFRSSDDFCISKEAKHHLIFRSNSGIDNIVFNDKQRFSICSGSDNVAMEYSKYDLLYIFASKIYDDGNKNFWSSTIDSVTIEIPEYANQSIKDVIFELISNMTNNRVPIKIINEHDKYVSKIDENVIIYHLDEQFCRLSFYKINNGKRILMNSMVSYDVSKESIVEAVIKKIEEDNDRMIDFSTDSEDYYHLKSWITNCMYDFYDDNYEIYYDKSIFERLSEDISDCPLYDKDRQEFNLIFDSENLYEALLEAIYKSKDLVDSMIYWCKNNKLKINYVKILCDIACPGIFADFIYDIDSKLRFDILNISDDSNYALDILRKEKKGAADMSELSLLTSQRDDLLKKIREIESECEGIENENNAKRIQELNLSQAKLLAQKNQLSAKLTDVQNKLTEIGKEITELSGTGVDRILEAIKKQRWYFIKNKPKVLLDRDTGLLWANLNYYNIMKNDNMDCHVWNEDYSVVKTYEFDGYKSWNLPSKNQAIKLTEDKSFPFMDKNSSLHYIINMKGKSISAIRLSDVANISMYLGSNYPNTSNHESGWLPCSPTLVENSDYEKNVSPGNQVYTEKERLQFTLDLFVENELMPIFDDEEISELYHKIYFEKPALVDELQKVQSEIENLSKITVLTSEFDYKVLLSKYDVDSINNSLVKYTDAVKRWIDGLLDKLDYFELSMSSNISELNDITESLCSKDFSSLSNGHKRIFDSQKSSLERLFSVNLKEVRRKLLTYKNNAVEIEKELELSDIEDNPLECLEELEKQSRPKFEFIAEHTAQIIKDALLKVEFFDNNKDFVKTIISVFERWFDEFQSIINIDTEEPRKKVSVNKNRNSGNYFKIWIESFFNAEKILIPLCERYIKTKLVSTKEKQKIYSQCITCFNTYIISVSKYFKEQENSNVYALHSFTDLQLELIKIANVLKCDLKEVIFGCENIPDKVFLLNLADECILHKQIDSIIQHYTGNSKQLSSEITGALNKIKCSRLDVCLDSPKSYQKECDRYLEAFWKIIEDIKTELNI